MGIMVIGIPRYQLNRASTWGMSVQSLGLLDDIRSNSLSVFKGGNTSLYIYKSKVNTKVCWKHLVKLVMFGKPNLEIKVVESSDAPTTAS